jgi:hypothetical protein
MKYLKDRCLKALDLLRGVAHKNWEAKCATIKLYWAHVRSKLDFGCMVYGSARPSALEVLIGGETLHHVCALEPFVPHQHQVYT